MSEVILGSTSGCYYLVILLHPTHNTSAPWIDLQQTPQPSQRIDEKSIVHMCLITVVHNTTHVTHTQIWVVNHRKCLFLIIRPETNTKKPGCATCRIRSKSCNKDRNKSSNVASRIIQYGIFTMTQGFQMHLYVCLYIDIYIYKNIYIYI